MDVKKLVGIALVGCGTYLLIHYLRTKAEEKPVTTQPTPTPPPKAVVVQTTPQLPPTSAITEVVETLPRGYGGQVIIKKAPFPMPPYNPPKLRFVHKARYVPKRAILKFIGCGVGDWIIIQPTDTIVELPEECRYVKVTLESEWTKFEGNGNEVIIPVEDTTLVIVDAD